MGSAPCQALAVRRASQRQSTRARVGHATLVFTINRETTMHPFTLTEEQIKAVSGGLMDYYYFDQYGNDFDMGGYWPGEYTWGVGEAGGPFDPAYYIM